MIELKIIEEKDKELLIEIFKDQEVKKTYMIPDFEDESMYEKMVLALLQGKLIQPWEPFLL